MRPHRGCLEVVKSWCGDSITLQVSKERLEYEIGDAAPDPDVDIAAAKAQGAAEATATIVKWLMDQGPTAWMLADAINLGDHITKESNDE